MQNTNKLVEQYMPLVHKIVGGMNICDNQKIDLAYEDLLQLGYLTLVRLAQKCGNDPNFEKIARTAIRNALLDQVKYASYRFTPYHDEYLAYQGKDDERLDRILTRLSIEKLRDTCAGCTKKGFQSILFELNGYTRKEISAFYGVPPTHVGAWVSRARKVLKKAYLA